MSADRRHFPNFLEAYMNYTENTEPPYLYRLWCGISTIASALQRKCWLRWDRILFPNLYVVLVGPSGVRKGSAMYPAQDLIRNVNIKLASEAVTREQLITELSTATDNTENPKTGLPELFSSLTVFSKEFTVFLGFNNTQLIMDLTDWYDCDESWKYSTKTSGKYHIKGVWLNIIGATTPSQLQTSLPVDAIGGGLSSRVFFVYENKRGKKVRYPSGINWVDKEEEEVLKDLDEDTRDKLIDDLMEIKSYRGEWKFDRSFQPVFDKWDEDYESMTKFDGTFLESYYTRRTTHVLKLAMIMNVNRIGDKIITGDDLQQAADILSATEEKMLDTFTGIGRNENAFILGRAVAILNEKREMMYSELLSLLMNDASHDQLWAVVVALNKMGRLDYTPFLDKETGKEDILIKYKKETNL